MPFFTPGDDPGSSFPELLRRDRLAPFAGRRAGAARGRRRLPVPHATTCVALRYADGVVMAGDRRATSGNLISHRTMEKVVPGRPPQRRRHRRRGRSGDGDGQALPAPARALREGRGHAAQPRGQGQPALDDGARQPAGGDAGPRRRADLRRLRPAPAAPAGCSAYDVTGGRYEERELRRHRLGQPARRHRHQGRLPRRAWTATTPSTSCVRALWEAADADSATGGPDPLRGIYPVVATITADGFERVADDELAAASSAARRSPSRRPRERSAAHEHAVLRRARTGDEGPGGLRPQGHRPRPRRSSPCVYDDGIAHRAPRTRRTRCARSARSTTASPSPASASTTSSTSCASPACGPPTSRATSTAATTSTPAAWPTSTPRSSARSSPTR